MTEVNFMNDILKQAGFFSHTVLHFTLETYNKPPKPVDDLIELLSTRGMIFDCKVTAKHLITHASYYRLRSYWYNFESCKISHQFIKGTNFNDVINIYNFDRKLRKHFLEAIDCIETSIRALWSQEFAINYSPHAYSNYSRGLYIDERLFRKNIKQLKEILDNSDKEFVLHFRRKYIEDYPPIWASVEVMTFGLISRFYKNTKPIQLKNKTCGVFNFDVRFFDGLLEHLTYLRNICAHQSRFWNISPMKRLPTIRTKPSELVTSVHQTGKNRIYNTLVVVQHMLNIICKNNIWKSELIQIIENHPIDTKQMGFPANWQSLDAWK
ncbi:Abi family protein [Marinicella sp. W31]|uniref:Abi family protein n=1 Tax=Marinicella sp. W31 TaxID=3023713 RepID=UPI003758459D